MTATTATEVKIYKNTSQNWQALNQARSLNYQFKQPIYCAIDEDDNIFDLSIGQPTYNYGEYYIWDEVGQAKKAEEKEIAIEQEHSLTFTRKGKESADFTFTLDGEEFTGLWSRNKDAIRSYYRVPELGIKARTFSNLIKKVKKI